MTERNKLRPNEKGRGEENVRPLCLGAERRGVREGNDVETFGGPTQ